MKTAPMESLRSLVLGLVGMAENRLRLLQSELGDETDRLGSLLAFQILIGLLGLLTVQFIALIVMALVWDTPWRVWAAVLLTASAATATVLAVRGYQRRKRRSSSLFATSLDELRKDREALQDR